MKGDFSRDTFRAHRHYSGVLMQQGRVTLDADWNEQQSISLHYLRSMAADIIGWHGTPHPESSAPGADGFRIDAARGDLRIGPGHYYVDGILCENEGPCFYSTQPGSPTPEGASFREDRGHRLVVLDVWERHVTSLEDASLREIALGGADTCTRSQVVWQVRVLPISGRGTQLRDQDELRAALNLRRPEQVASLRARTTAASGPHTEATKAGYGGLENRLYRIEIHDGGPEPRFKWSRTNGSEAYVISSCSGNEIDLDLIAGADVEWAKPALVELVDDDSVLSQRGGVLTEVIDSGASPNRLVVGTAAAVDPDRDALLRRWDGTGTVQKGQWIDLDAGIQIEFGEGHMRAGDYWLIPARSETGGIEWPTVGSVPQWARPRGIRHHYAPLALLEEGTVDLRRFFNPLAD